MPDGDRPDVLQRALTWPDRARSLTVIDDDSYVSTAEELKGIKALLDEADETFDPIIEKQQAALDESKTKKAKVRGPLLQAERIIKDALTAYKTRKAEQAREAQRLIDAAAKKKADDEALARAADLEREGTAWGDHGLKKEAEQIVEERIKAKAQPPPVPLVRTTPPRVAGIVHRMTWAGRCESLPAFVDHVATHPEHAHALQLRDAACKDLALVKYCVANPEHRHLLDTRPMVLNELARQLRDGMNRIPGLRAFETPDVSARGR